MSRRSQGCETKPGKQALAIDRGPDPSDGCRPIGATNHLRIGLDFGTPDETEGAVWDLVGMMGQVKDNPQKGRFELDVGGQIVFARYSRQGSTLIISHVEAPPPLRGTGAADRLMTGVMEVARREGMQVMPLCGYAAAWIRRHKPDQA